MFIAGLLLLLAAPAFAASPSAAGHVTLTEFQADTTRVAPYYGEWFELYNNYPGTLDFNGVTITNATGQSITIEGAPLVGRGDYLVLGVSQNQTYGATDYNGNVPVDVLYSFFDFNFAAPADKFTITYAGVTLDEVQWTSAWSVSADNAHAASLNAYTLEWANDASVNWCASATYLPDSGMKGTPGAANDYCGNAAGADNDGDGYSERDGDCRDDDATINPEAVDGNDGIPEASGGGGNPNDDANCNGVRDDGILDGDGDGYAPVDGDCNDSDDDVFPGAIELDDELDNDCNQCIDDVDRDSDGYGWSESDTCGDDCSPSTATSGDDLAPDRDRDVHPGAIEIPYDGYDQDCDGFDLCDYDGDGYDSDQCPCDVGRCDCDDNNTAIHPGAPEDTSDGLDNDCDGDIDIPDRDGDGWTEEAGDCMDVADPVDLKEISATVHPDATEICGDLLDNDCDGFYDNLPSCTTPTAYATVRGGGLCGVSPTAGGPAALLVGALMGLAAVSRRREGGSR